MVLANYDTIGLSRQRVKCTQNPSKRHFNCGDRIPLKDGLYITLEGWFLVVKGRLHDEGYSIMDLWGNVCDPCTMIP